MVSYDSNSKGQINTRLLHLGYCSKKPNKNLEKSNFYFLPHGGGGGGGGDKNSLLMLF